MAGKFRGKESAGAMDILVPAAGSVLGGTVNPLGGPVGAALGRAGVSLWRRGAAAAVERRAAQAELELERFLAENPELAAKVVPEDFGQQELFLRMYRSAVECVDPKAIGPLVQLVGQYIGREKDWFFFAVARLFEELAGAEFATLRVILDACLHAPQTSGVVVAFARSRDPEAETRVEVTWWVREAEGRRQHEFTYVDVPGERVVSVIYALKRNAIATESGAGGAGEQSAAGKMVIRLELAQRLRTLLGL